MSKKVSIKITEAQPLPCPYCGGFYGYQYSDLFSPYYIQLYMRLLLTFELPFDQ